MALAGSVIVRARTGQRPSSERFRGFAIRPWRSSSWWSTPDRPTERSRLPGDGATVSSRSRASGSRSGTRSISAPKRRPHRSTSPSQPTAGRSDRTGSRGRFSTEQPEVAATNGARYGPDESPLSTPSTRTLRPPWPTRCGASRTTLLPGGRPYGEFPFDESMEACEDKVVLARAERGLADRV